MVAPSPMTLIFMAYERVTSMPPSVSSSAAMASRSAGSCQYMAMRSSVSTSSILLSISMSIGVRVRLERSRDVGVAAAELVQALLIERAGRKRCCREDIEGDVMAGGNAMDTVGDGAVERSAEDARGA